ncbi:hypothetical protein EVA_04305 [gut metagenome]|uniref:Uncharacterized protein n=1 Tax=gut metagenome TaxID=749906 RepID=J9GIZ0_9ZZZZ
MCVIRLSVLNRSRQSNRFMKAVGSSGRTDWVRFLFQ